MTEVVDNEQLEDDELKVDVQKEIQVKSGLPLLQKERAFTTNLHFFPCPEEIAQEKTTDVMGKEYFRNLIWSYSLGKIKFSILGQADKGLPNGVVSRLIINWIDNEIIYNSKQQDKGNITGGYKIKWSESITEFCIKNLGLKKHGGIIREIQSQFEKIAGITFQTTRDNKGALEEYAIPFVVEKFFRWRNVESEDSDEVSNSWVVIHPIYVDYVLNRNFYVEPKIVKLFLRNAEGIDLYKYFKYIANRQKSTTRIPLSEIREKLGWTGKTDNLMRKVSGIIKKIMEHDKSIKLEIIKGSNQWNETVIVIYKSDMLDH